MKEALAYCHKHLGDNVTILHDCLYTPTLPKSIDKMVKKQGKEAGGPWEYYESFNFYGWEAERVVAVTDGTDIMELITRARTHLAVILLEKSGAIDAKQIKEYFQKAADLGLVEVLQMSLMDQMDQMGLLNQHDDDDMSTMIKRSDKEDVEGSNDLFDLFCKEVE